MSMFTPDKDKSSVDVIKETMPTIYITKESIIKMKLFIEGCSDEIGWLGTVQESDGDYLIDDVMLFDQEVHSTTTEITPEGLSSFGEGILAEENGVDLWNSIKVWGHSHVNMSVFASGQDDAQMVTFKDCGHDWFIRIIANKKGSMKVDLYDYKHGIVYKDMPFVEVLSSREYELQEQIEALEGILANIELEVVEGLKPSVKADMDAKVRKKSYTSTYKGVKTIGKTGTTTAYEDYKKKHTTEVTGKGTTGTYGYDDYYEGYYEDYTQQGYTTQEKVTLHQENLELGMDAVWFVQGLAQCISTDEAREELAIWGYNDVYTEQEIEQLLLNAKEEAI